MAQPPRERALDVRYTAFKTEWANRRQDPNFAGGGDWLVDRPELSLDAAPFIQTLRTLGDVTQDRRFAELRSWIIQSGLIDLATGHWSRFDLTLAQPLTRELCEMTKDLIEGGTSRRLAVAQAVAAYALPGATFEAACKNFDRVFGVWQKSA